MSASEQLYLRSNRPRVSKNGYKNHATSVGLVLGLIIQRPSVARILARILSEATRGREPLYHVLSTFPAAFTRNANKPQEGLQSTGGNGIFVSNLAVSDCLLIFGKLKFWGLKLAVSGRCDFGLAGGSKPGK